MPSVVPMSYFSPDETINPGAYTFEIVDENGRANLATIENSSTASKAYAVGEYMVYDGRLRRVTTAITSGGTIVPSGEGANVSQTTFGDEISNLVRKGDGCQDGFLNAYANDGQVIQIGVRSSLGRYILFIKEDGIYLWDDIAQSEVNAIKFGRYSSIGSDTKSAYVDAAPQYNQYVRIMAESDTTKYMLMATSSGLSLYNLKTNTTEHNINWTS